MASRGKLMVDLALKKRSQIVQTDAKKLSTEAKITDIAVSSNLAATNLSADTDNGSENCSADLHTEVNQDQVLEECSENGNKQPLDSPVSKVVGNPKKRSRTEDEKKEAQKAKYPLLDGCTEKCRKKCSGKFTYEQRKSINDSFWDLSFPERRLYLDGCININPVKGHRSSQSSPSRKRTLSYTLPISSRKADVCKSMFLSTLGLKTDGMITEFVRSKESGSGLLYTITDRRGKATPKNKCNEDIIKEHIMSFHPQISHYRASNSPNRRYLDSTLTIRAMWEDYKSKYGTLSYIVYQRVFQSENIGFGKPSQDDCNLCVKYNAHCNDGDENHVSSVCEQCEMAKHHQAKAEEARVHYREDVKEQNKEVGVFAADMQKVILLPKMTIKEHFFVSRLVVFNETFASLKEDGDYVMLWHEAIAGRSAVEVASAYIKCVNICEKEQVIFWADNCSGQNKNWTLYTTLCWCVNQDWGPKSISLKYLEKGHTFMRADSVHGSIGRRMKKVSEICTFSDFSDLCGKAGGKIKPISLNCTDFYVFEDGHRSRKSKNVTLPHLSSISVAEFRKGSRSLWFMEDFHGDVKEVDFLKPKFRLDVTPGVREHPRGIPGAKLQSLLKLVQAFPPAKRKFWQELPVNDASTDLVEDFQ